MEKETANQKGLTLVELIVVIGVIAILAWALFPLITTTYNSWRTADARIEVLELGRVGMTKLGRESRIAFDIVNCTDSARFDYYPDWSTNTEHRFLYESTTDYEIQFGTQTPFADNFLTGPISSFEYLAYNRRMDISGVTAARKVNSFRFRFGVSEKRQILPAYMNPMEFRSFVQMRLTREGYFFSRFPTYATEAYRFGKREGDDLCVRAFCDRIDSSAPLVTQTATISCYACGAGPWVINLVHNAADDSYSACGNILALGVTIGSDAWEWNPNHKCVKTTHPSYDPDCGWPRPSHWVEVNLDDGVEQCIMRDAVSIARTKS